MALTPGVRFGAYDIVASIGAGGMGEVYRARDRRLQRDVAVKILPEAFAGDAERLARFEREARALAALNHPNIATIHGIEECAGRQALVMELVEGETLASRIARGPVPVADVVNLAAQIADAIDAAHGKGIVHRDLKPANISVSADGAVKVLDFGLAKTIVSSPGAEPSDNETTMLDERTREGTVMGTTAYMSPEQARGEPVDGRTDIWAFGCVVYELITGRRAFVGRSATDVLAAVIRAEPDWRALPDDTPDAVRRLLDRCLRKDVQRRLRSIADARLELDDARLPAPQATGNVRRGWAPYWIAAALALMAVAIGIWALRPQPVPGEVRLEMFAPLSRYPAVAVSPDGQVVAYTATVEGRDQLWLRPLAAAQATPLGGAEGAHGPPFWSPDGRSIAFFADARLKRINLDDGSIQIVASNVPAPIGGSWNRQGVILYSSNAGAPIWRVGQTGGEPVAATRFDARQGAHMHPAFLPDGRHFLYFVSAPAAERGVYLGRLDSLESRRLLASEGPAVYASAAGRLLFLRDRKILQQPFDPVRLELSGSPEPFIDADQPGAVIAASEAGPIVYRTPPEDSGQRELTWFGRDGSELKRVVYADRMTLGPALSHDGRRIGVFRSTDGNVDIWSYDVERGTWDRMTDHPGDDIYPLWSFDGRRLVFGSRRGTMDLFVRLLSSPLGSEEVVLSTPRPKFPTDWSRDGRYVLFNVIDPDTGVDIQAVPVDGERTPTDVLRTKFNEQHAQFSPDGRWIAYQSNRTGRFEIYVRPFSGPGADVPVSTSGGEQARWHPEGAELFYIAADDALMAVPIRVHPDRGIEAGEPKRLFPTAVGSTAPNTNRHQWMITRDGRSFVMNTRPQPANASPLHVVLNWRPR
jgi:Tol biopolymer transport system component